jgi:hypothetical protein
MKRYVLILFALLAPVPFSSSTPVSSDALGAVRYEVRYQLKGIDTKVADATFSLENSTWKQQKVLHARAVIRAASVFRLFMNAEYLADTYLLPGNREPLYYFCPIKKGGKEGKFECIYDLATGTITSEFVRPPADPVLSTFPVDGRTMDLLSLLQYVRFLDLPEGRSLSLHVLKDGISIPAVLTCQGCDRERYPDRNTDRFLLTMNGKGLMENGSGNKITVWRSSGTDRIFLGLEVNLGSGMMTVSLKD